MHKEEGISAKGGRHSKGNTTSVSPEGGGVVMPTAEEICTSKDWAMLREYKPDPNSVVLPAVSKDQDGLPVYPDEWHTLGDSSQGNLPSHR